MSIDLPEIHADVLVVGAGNAGLSAAVSAAQAGARVAVLEKAPESLRGGNTYFTGDLRFPWSKAEELFPLIGDVSETEMNELRELVKPYTQADFYDDVMNVTSGLADPELLQVLVSTGYPTMKWMADLGHRWVSTYGNPSASHVLRLNGGGAALSDRWFDIALAHGVEVYYSHAAVELQQANNGHISGARVIAPDGFKHFRAPTIILASGGFESNAAMRASYLGPGWDNVKVRGVPYNTGDGLVMAMNIGAVPAGEWSGCHASPQDYNRPPYSLRVGPSATVEYRRHEYPWCIMVNRDGNRFTDEGADFRAYTYARIGRDIMRQPAGVAFQIFDQKATALLSGSTFSYKDATGGTANSLSELAALLGINAEGLVRTVNEFNAAVQPGAFEADKLDGKRTDGLLVPKSNWALPIDEPPYSGYSTICGITFTFGGLKVNSKTQVIHNSDRPIPGLYAAGEIVGGIFFQNYPGGSGMTQGAAFGRIAGTQAAREALGS